MMPVRGARRITLPFEKAFRLFLPAGGYLGGSVAGLPRFTSRGRVMANEIAKITRKEKVVELLEPSLTVTVIGAIPL